MTTRTDAKGSYAFSVSTSQPYQWRSRWSLGRALVCLLLAMVRIGAASAVGTGRRCSCSSWGTTEIVQNVRLRPVRTLAPGESMVLSVEPDSSLVWDKEWDPWLFPSFNTLEEEFRVPVQTDGVLTIEARPEAGGMVATLPCPYLGCPSSQVQGTISIPVEARQSPFYVSVQIPRESAPQRYVVQTSLRYGFSRLSTFFSISQRALQDLACSIWSPLAFPTGRS